MTLNELLSKLEHAKKSGTGWTARCPAHEDRENSLSVKEQDGKILLHCFAGCAPEAICEALGVQIKDLFVESGPRKKRKTDSSAASRNDTSRKAVTEYVYTDEHGHPAAKKIRYEPKFFSWMRFESGEWKTGLGNIKPGLYRWAEIKNSDWVLIVEGEKDADNAAKLGLPATTSGGVNTWTAAHTKALDGKRVAIIADADAPGRIHARKIATALWDARTDWNKPSAGTDPSPESQDDNRGIKLLELPGSKDLSEALEHGLPKAAIEALISEAQEWKPRPGADVLDAVYQFIRRFVALSENQARVTTLWLAHTYAFDAAEATAYLAINSAEKQSGKTRLLEVCCLLAKNPWQTARVSAAVLVRKIDSEAPTLLLDEADAAFASGDEYSETVRGVLNAGARRGGVVSACVGQGANISYKDFSAYCPKAIAGIGVLPDTVMDRSIPIRLKRAEKGTVERLRLRVAKPEADRMAAELGAWASASVGKLRDLWPEMPDDMSDRQADLCEPMVAIADLAGADWPEKARTAFVEICRQAANYDDSLQVKLLADIRDVFDGKHDDQMSLGGPQVVDRMASAELVKKLVEIETSPWSELMHGRAVTTSKVARMLKPFEIQPGNMRVDGGVKKGYFREQFQDAWSRYLPKIDDKVVNREDR